MKKALLIVMSLFLLAGGSLSANGASEGSAAGADAATELKIILPGNRPPRMDAIITAVEEKSRDAVNVDLNVVFVPWGSDLKQKIQMSLASGEKNDLVFDAPWNGMAEKISAGYYEPLDDLIKEHGPNLLKLRGDLMDANMFKGNDGVYRMYGVPMTNTAYQGRSILIRKDIREELGVAPITNREELISFLYKVKQEKPEMIPFLSPRSDWVNTMALMQRDTGIDHYFWTPVGEFVFLYFKNDDGIVYNLFDQMEEDIWALHQEARKLYQDGIFYPDVLSVQNDDLFNEGRVAAKFTNDFGVSPGVIQKITAVNPSYEIESITFLTREKGKYVSDKRAFNFQALATVSENKEKAIRFLDWTNASQENYDLVAYGIEGEDWEPVGESQYKSLNDQYSYFPYAWVWNPIQDRRSTSYTEEDVKNLVFFADPANIKSAPTLGFTLNTVPIENEIAQFNAIKEKYMFAMGHGVVDPDEYWAKFKDEAEDILKAIQVELQKQLDEYHGK